MRFLPNGQWTLAKSDEAPKGPEPTTLHGLVGKTHTVEVHPHVDQLYRLKNHIQANPNGLMSVADIKKHPEFGHFGDALKKLGPRITPDMVDQHIASLPKKKVEIKVAPYTMGAQQHREGVPEYVASVGFHPDTLKNMSPKETETWKAMKGSQHDLGGHEHQVGWARIDPYKTETENTSAPRAAMKRLMSVTTNPEDRATIQTEMDNHRDLPSDATERTLKRIIPNNGHWHIDEIQSDFGVPKTLDERFKTHTDPKNIFHDIMGGAMQTADPNGPGRGHADDNNFAKDPEAFARAYPELAEHLDAYKKSYNERENANEEAGRDIHERAAAGDHRYDTPEESTNRQAKYAANRQKHETDIKPFTDKAHELAERIGKERSSKMSSAKDMHKLLSHGHDDPMHMIHSAVNELGRKNGIDSMSMDMPKHQAHQSGLRPSNQSEHHNDSDYDADARLWNHIVEGGVSDEQKNHMWNTIGGQNLIDQHNHDINFKSAANKLGPEGLKQWANLALSDNSSWMHDGSHAAEWDEQTNPHDDQYSNIGDHLDSAIKEKLHAMSGPERDALSRFLGQYSGEANSILKDNLGYNDDDDNGDYSNIDPDAAEYDLPVHQINTYEKRPKKLGFKPVDKREVLGEHPTDPYNQVQYAKLAKRLRLLQELLKKV